MNNTDAEGRLTLADALVYACDQGVEKVCVGGQCLFVTNIPNYGVSYNSNPDYVLF